MKRLRQIVSSPKFFYACIGLIAASCLFFAATITYRIPSDEFFHFRFIEFYADQPITHGPFITDQGLDHFDLRDITRTPNYLYHYSMSFVLQITRLFTNSIFTQVFVIRTLTIAMGIGALFVVRKILRQIKASPLMQNSVTFLLGLTGMLLWIFAAVNYDVPAILFYLLCASVSLKITDSNGVSLKQLILFSLFAMLCVLTKVTFAPFLALLALAVVVMKRKDLKFKQDLSLKKWSHVVLIAIVLLIGFLFVERIGGNIVQYRQIEVACDKIHTYEQCLIDDVFSRNENQLQVYAQAKLEDREVHYLPLTFTRRWLGLMYERVYFYFGHQQMVANQGGVTFAAWILGGFGLLTLIFWRRLAESHGEKLLLFVTLSYALVMYVFNLQTYLKFGQEYAFQGRYLLPIIPFAYYFGVKLILLTYRSLGDQAKKVFVGVIAAAFVFGVYTHLPLLVFYRGTESKWWPEPMQSFNLTVQDGLRKINIKTLY